MKHDKVDISWWTVENREIKLTDKAPDWLIKEMEHYEEVYRKFDEKMKDYFAYDGPTPNLRHPVIDRLSEEEFELLDEILRDDVGEGKHLNR
ncbi:hypothetical protein QYZ88_016000 [Lachnospiraceae bacterium C1.1]|nr:hypothetical protein [Lachnospiraceae bacterium C1.1]